MTTKKRDASRLHTPEAIKHAAKMRTIARQERGASWGALTTLGLMQALSERGQATFTPAEVIRRTGQNKGAVISHFLSLVAGGFIERRERGLYTLARSFDMTALPADRRRQLAGYVAGLPQDAAPAFAPAPVAPAPNTKALRAALKALAPFARLGARLEGKGNPDSVPMLLRKDGVQQRDFVEAHHARERLLAALGKGGEEAATMDAADELDRFFL